MGPQNVAVGGKSSQPRQPGQADRTEKEAWMGAGEPAAIPAWAGLPAREAGEAPD